MRASAWRARDRGPEQQRTSLTITKELAAESVQRKAILYDRDGDEHYDAASALIKSLRGSDPDAGLYWLARMLEGGEDIRFITRRLVILASEDIGNADPHALPLAVAAMQACEFIGLPECALTLSQAVIYLACAPRATRPRQRSARRAMMCARGVSCPCRYISKTNITRRETLGTRRRVRIRT